MLSACMSSKSRAGDGGGVGLPVVFGTQKFYCLLWRVTESL